MIIKQLALGIVVAALMLAIAAGLRLAEGAGMLGSEEAKRAMQVLIGLVFAAYANYMPKQLGPARRSPHAESRAQAVLRVGGWSFTLAGLAYAGLWALAPLSVADIASMTVLAAAMAVAIGYTLWSFTACLRAGSASVSR